MPSLGRASRSGELGSDPLGGAVRNYFEVTDERRKEYGTRRYENIDVGRVSSLLEGPAEASSSCASHPLYNNLRDREGRATRYYTSSSSSSLRIVSTSIANATPPSQTSAMLSLTPTSDVSTPVIITTRAEHNDDDNRRPILRLPPPPTNLV